MDQRKPPAPHEPQPVQYEPPRIELVLTPEELEREDMDAGPAANQSTARRRAVC
jgi:hypothetical protein